MDTQSAYRQTTEYLYAQLPMFSRTGKAAITKDLSNIIKLCEALGNPHLQFKSIHIAGTNGKGSTSHMLAAILQSSGYKTGLHTSPHLSDLRERMRINGMPVGRDWVINFVQQHKELIEEIQPSFFEITVAMAFAAFAEEKVDIAVIETGLGGRLDSTNIVKPILSIITNISYDHTDILGTTLPEIAAEKAGIIKEKVPVLIGEQQTATEKVFFEHAMRRQSTVYYADALWDLVRVKQDPQYQYFKAVHKAKREINDLHTDMLGNYQQKNIKTVLAAIEILSATGGFTIHNDNIYRALTKVKKLTGLRGRWDWVQQHPIIIADVAHNPAGLQEVMNQWQQITAANKHIVLGFVRDKDVTAALAHFTKDNTYYFTQANVPRALPVNELKAMAEETGLEGNAYTSVAEAVQTARSAMGKDDALLITGSFFIAGEAIEYLDVNNGLLFPTTLEQHF